MPVLPEVPDGVPEWLRFAIYVGFVAGAFFAARYGWRNGASGPSQSAQNHDVVVRGGIIDDASAEKLVAALDRLTDAVAGAVRFAAERDRKERAEDEMEEMEERLAARLEKRLNRYPPS